LNAVVLLVSVAWVVLNVVVLLVSKVVRVLCVVLNVVVVENEVSLVPLIVLVEVDVCLEVSCVTVNGPSREPPSFTYTSLTLLIVPLSLTARKEI